MKKTFRYISGVAAVLLLAVIGGLLIGSARQGHWDASTAYATLFVGLIAAFMVVWQGNLIKQQIAFSTYLDLDKEWNSAQMIEARLT